MPQCHRWCPSVHSVKVCPERWSDVNRLGGGVPLDRDPRLELHPLRSKGFKRLFAETRTAPHTHTFETLGHLSFRCRAWQLCVARPALVSSQIAVPDGGMPCLAATRARGARLGATCVATPGRAGLTRLGKGAWELLSRGEAPCVSPHESRTWPTRTASSCSGGMVATSQPREAPVTCAGNFLWVGQGRCSAHPVPALEPPVVGRSMLHACGSCS